MGKGRRNENKLVNAINRESITGVDAMPNGYSGSHASTQADIVVRTPAYDYVIEAKTHGWDRGDRKTFLDTEDVADLASSINGYTRGVGYLDVSRLEPLAVCVGDLTELPSSDEDVVAEALVAEIPDVWDPSVTTKGNVRVTVPSTDDWPSARSGRSKAVVVADACRFVRLDRDGVEVTA